VSHYDGRACGRCQVLKIALKNSIWVSRPRRSAWSGVHANYRNSPFCSECQRVVLQPRSARSRSCALSAKAARALNRAALETNCRTFRFHSSTSQRTKSPLCSEPRARPALGRRFKLSWQSPSPITFCVFSNTSSFTAAISDYMGLQANRAEAPNKSLLATLVAMPPSITIESRRISAQGVANPQWKTSQGNKEKLPHGYEHKDHRYKDRRSASIPRND